MGLLSEVMKKMTRKASTEGYPAKPSPAPPRTRARLMRDKRICIHCGACTTVCPSKACYFVQEKDKRRVEFNLAYCTFCAQCVEICPVKCLKMINEYEYATAKKEDLLI